LRKFFRRNLLTNTQGRVTRMNTSDDPPLSLLARTGIGAMVPSPVVNSTIAKLARAEIAGVNAHTLPLALERAERDKIDFSHMSERQAALALLERTSYPTTMAELNVFLNINHTLTPSVLLSSEITDQYAVPYVTWLAGFLDDPEPNIQKNARVLLRWLVTN